ncbi:MAG: hypothetical protein ACPGNT_05340 [Rhodospirillales bacterium]
MRGKALIVFTDATEISWLRILKPGFRHCFAMIAEPEGWIIYDTLAHQTEIVLWRGLSEAEVLTSLCARGNRVVPAILLDAPKKLAPLRPLTCVEAIKRLLGLRAPWVFTPYQLYRRLEKMHELGIFSLTLEQKRNKVLFVGGTSASRANPGP